MNLVFERLLRLLHLVESFLELNHLLLGAYQLVTVGQTLFLVYILRFLLTTHLMLKFTDLLFKNGLVFY